MRPGSGPLGLGEAVGAWCAGLEAASAAELAGAGSAGYYLRQAELESVIAVRMAARAAVSIHRALLAGATLAQVADAAGMTCAGAAGRWKSWADGQRQLERQIPGLGLSEREYLRAAAVVGADIAAGRSPVPECGDAGGKRK